jgi:hypothetical protein
MNVRSHMRDIASVIGILVVVFGALWASGLIH